MAFSKIARYRAGLVLVSLLAAGLALIAVRQLRASPATGPALCCQAIPNDAQAIRASVSAALAQATQGSAAQPSDWRVQSVYQRGDWAYAFVKGYAAGAPLPGVSQVALAQRTASGWQTVLPRDGAAYDQALAHLPEALIPAAARPLLTQASASAAYFSGFNLPFPAGQSAYVFWHWYPALDFSIGDPGPGDTIRAAKAGTAVFVKGSSTVECGDPPPNWTCWMYANAIVIQSAPNEYAWYLHLQANSIPDWLKEGVEVPAGADIGQEGKTGWASLPHLHFQVSTWFACCTGSGDGRFPTWPLGTLWGVDFKEYAWSQVPYRAVSQNGSPAPADSPPSAPAPAPTPDAAPADSPAQANAPAPAATEAAVGSACANPYAVRAGDYLIRIATFCNVNEAALVAANPGLNPNVIYAGQLLSLPSLGGRPDNNAAGQAATQPASMDTAAAPASRCTGTHSVTRGESLSQIGTACGLSWQQLATANHINYPYTIYTGQVLQYP